MSILQTNPRRFARITGALYLLVQRLGALALAPGMVGEGVLTIWLLTVGVDPDRWAA